MSIFKRKDNGKWRVQINYKDNDGKYKRISRDVKTRKEAVALESSIQSKLGASSNPNITIAQVARLFLDSSGDTLRKSTISNYEKCLRLYVLPFLGDKKIREVTTLDIDNWKKKIARKKFKKNYLENIFKAIRKIFSFAELEFNISNASLKRSGRFKDDPNAVSDEKDTLHFWSLDQFKKWIDAIDGMISNTGKKGQVFTLRAVRIYVSIMMLAGLRKGEANALLVSDFHDGDYPFLSVTKSLNEKLKGIPYLVTSPKTKKSVRDVPIPDLLASMIRDHVALLKRIPYFDKDRFFLCGGIKPVADTTTQKIKEAVERKAGIPHIRVHDLRHSYVSLLVNAGTDITVISNLVGHSTTDITLKVYSHLYPKTKNVADSKINEIIESDKEKEK